MTVSVSDIRIKTAVSLTTAEQSLNLRFASRRAEAISNATVDAARQQISISIDYLWLENSTGFGGFLAGLFGMVPSASIIVFGAMTLSLNDTGRLSEIIVNTRPDIWRFKPLYETPRMLKPIYMMISKADKPDYPSGTSLSIVWDRQSAQLAVQVAKPRRWQAIADNLAVGDDGNGKFCELRVFGLPDDDA